LPGVAAFVTTGVMHRRFLVPRRAPSVGRVFLAVIWLALAGSDLRADGLFADPNLEAAVRRQVFAKRDTGEPLAEADVVNVSTVDARRLGIRSLVGLEKCRNLAMIELEGNQVADLAPVAGLPRLQFLDLRDNALENLAPLATLPSLQYLQLAGNRVRSVAALAGLTNLAALYLGGNRIEDITPLLGLRRLASLYLDDNRIRSIDGLGGLRGLSSLSLSGNRIADVTPLRGLEGVQHLFLERNRIRDLDALAAWVAADTDRRFAPFLNVYLAGNPLGSAARTRQWKELSATGVRLHREPTGIAAVPPSPGRH
jgi:internalin A